MGKKRIVLKYHTDGTLFRRDIYSRRRNQCIFNLNGSGMDILKTRDHAQKCRLAAAAWSQKTTDFSFFKLKADITGHLICAKGFGNLLNGKKCWTVH